MKKTFILTAFVLLLNSLFAQVDYATQIQPIFNSVCTSCHGSSGGLSMSSYSQLMAGNSNNGPVVIAGAADSSLIVTKSQANPPFGSRMPRNNQGYFDSNPSELQLIIDWINQGANENNVSVAEDLSSPGEYGLMRNYPNPFNPVTTIAYNLNVANFIEIEIYDMQGKSISSLVSGFHQPGSYAATWNGTNSVGNSVSAGMYIYQLRSIRSEGNGSVEIIQTNKMMLVK